MTTLFKTPKAPVLAAPAPMPDPVNEKQAGLRKAALASAQKTGRASTILTDYGAPKGEKLG